MNRVWITNGSTSIPPVINPLTAACHDGYLPTTVFLLDNPGIEAVTEDIRRMVQTVVTAYGGDEPAVEVTTIEEEADFNAIIDFVTSSIETAESHDAEIAVDVTPGRKFWSIISFRAGLNYDVDRLYYLHVFTDSYFGHCYPTIPRTAVELIDFTEVI